MLTWKRNKWSAFFNVWQRSTVHQAGSQKLDEVALYNNRGDVFQGNPSNPNHLKLLKIGLRSERTAKRTKQFYNNLYLEKKIKLTENRKPRKEQWHLKQCVINRTCKSRKMHVAYKFSNITALTSSILTSPKREIDRVNQL